MNNTISTLTSKQTKQLLARARMAIGATVRVEWRAAECDRITKAFRRRTRSLILV